MEVPLNHPFLWDFPLKTIHFWVPPSMETPLQGLGLRVNKIPSTCFGRISSEGLSGQVSETVLLLIPIVETSQPFPT